MFSYINKGLHEEGIAPAEMGWGTHEKWTPAHAEVPNEGPKNQLFLKQCGMNTWVRSFVPGHQILGMVIRHGEALSISEHLSVYSQDKSQTLYRY
jgi:homospermidine synthase